MKCAEVISAICAVFAAVFWFWSAMIHVPEILQTPLSGKGSISDIMRRQSRLSAVAAIFAAASAIAAAVALYGQISN